MRTRTGEGHRPAHHPAVYAAGVDPALLVLLLAAFTARATLLVTRDAFPPVLIAREWVEDRFGEYHPVAYLVTCAWCTSVWLAAGAVAGTLLAGVSVPVPVLTAGACSLFTGVLATLLPRPE